jgi:hypothetical protein
MIHFSFVIKMRNTLVFNSKHIFKLCVPYNDVRPFLIFKIIRLARVRLEFETTILQP